MSRYKSFKFLRHLFVNNPHSISIFISDDGVIDYIPSFYTKAGFGMESDYYREINPPYTVEKIGAEFMLVWNETKKMPVIDETDESTLTSAYKIISGGKGYLAFQKRRQMINATFDEKGTINFKYWYKQKRGYGINKGDKEISREIPVKSSFTEIGKAIDEIYFEVNQQHIV